MARYEMDETLDKMYDAYHAEQRTQDALDAQAIRSFLQNSTARLLAQFVPTPQRARATVFLMRRPMN